MTNSEKQTVVRDAKGLARWFSVNITIKVLGVTIWEYHFPPKSNVENDEA